jgi:hypothetical protein
VNGYAALIAGIYIHWYFGLKTQAPLVAFEGWIIYSVLWTCALDYISLWKTRFFLTRAASFRNIIVVSFILMLDFVLTSMLWVIFYICNLVGYFLLGIDFEHPDVVNLDVSSVVIGNIKIFDFWMMLPLGLLYSAALLTSLWLWAFVIVSFGARFLRHVPRLLNSLSTIVDFQDHPVKALGYPVAIFCAAVVGFVVFF